MNYLKMLLTVPLVLSIVLPSRGQKIRFTDTTNWWKFKYISLHGGTTYESYNTLQYSGDTTIGGLQYHKLVATPVREDTTAKKVYIRAYNAITHAFDTTDQVLYDYNLTVGDTIRYINNQAFNDTLIDWVTSVGTTQIAGISYKVWDFQSRYRNGNYYYYHVIEGLGCTTGLFRPVSREEPYNTTSQQMTCFQNNGTISSLSAPVLAEGVLYNYNINFDNAASCSLDGIKMVVKDDNGCMVIPNPINGESKIVFPRSIRSGNLIITNSVGHQVVNTSFESKDEIVVGNLIPCSGTYFYRVSATDEERSYSGVFSSY